MKIEDRNAFDAAVQTFRATMAVAEKNYATATRSAHASFHDLSGPALAQRDAALENAWTKWKAALAVAQAVRNTAIEKIQSKGA